MMKKRFFLLFLSLCLLLSIPLPAKAAEQELFTVSASGEAILRGSTFSVTLSPAREDIAAFVLHAAYDDSVTQVKASLSPGITDAYTYTSSENSRFSFVFAAASGSTLPAGESITLTFRTNSAANAENIPIRLEIRDAADANAVPLLTAPETHDLSFSFQAPSSSDCVLLSLTPPTGALSPAFSSDITEYTLAVPFTYTSLEFDAVPIDGASVRVNRKNLGAGGSTVDFLFTVTAADQKTKSVYTVSVTRLQKGVSMPADPGTPDAEDSEDLPAETSSEESVTAPSSTDSQPETAGSEVVYVSAETKATASEDKLLTAAIVLLSVGAGMALVVLAQRFSRKKSKDTDQEP